MKKYSEKLLAPTWYVHDILTITGQKLKKKGFTVLLVDADNTLIFDRSECIEEPMIALIKDWVAAGILVNIVSNGKKKRISNIFSQNDLAQYVKEGKIKIVANAHKPSAKRISRNLKMDEDFLANTLLIGDQIFTDILCAKRLKISSILVNPLSTKERFYIKIKRKIENLVKDFIKLELSDF